jgi:hypothetical protein
VYDPLNVASTFLTVTKVPAEIPCGIDVVIVATFEDSALFVMTLDGIFIPHKNYIMNKKRGILL